MIMTICKSLRQLVQYPNDVLRPVILKMVFFACVWCVAGISIAADLPPGWPWRGVNIVEEIKSFSPEQLATVLPSKGVNSVALRMLPRKRAKNGKLSPQEAWKQSLNWAEKMLDECKKMGIVATVVVESGFPLDPSVGYNETSPEFWNNAQNRNEVVKLASDLSRRFASRGAELAAYQVMSEPVMALGGKNLRPPQWDQFIGKIINAIRRNDSERWVAVAPPPWALPSSYRKFFPLPFPRIVYTAHMFAPHQYTHQGIKRYKKRYIYPGVINGKKWGREKMVSSLSMLREFQLRYDVPVWIGSFSVVRWAEGGEQYIKDLVSISNGYGWGWSYFAINGWNGWNPNYSSEFCCPPGTGLRLIKKQNVGVSSKRWGTLKQIFEPPPNQ